MFWFFPDAYSCFGFFTQILYNLTPILFVIQLKSGVIKHERTSIFGLLSLYCNAAVYFFTSMENKVKEDIQPIDYANLTGTYLGLVYLIIYIYYIHFKKDKMKGIIYIAIIVLSSVVVFIIIHFTVEEGNISDKIFKWIGVVFNVTEYFPLGFSIIYIFKHKISEKYTIFGGFFGFINCVVWLAWASYNVHVNHKELEHSIVANCLGICLEIAQIIFIFIFKNKDSDNENENNNIEEKTNDLKPAGIDLDNSEKEIKDNDPEYMQDYM